MHTNEKISFCKQQNVTALTRATLDGYAFQTVIDRGIAGQPTHL